MTTRKSELPIIPFASREAWETWLEEHHATSDGLWLKLAKRGSGLRTVAQARQKRLRIRDGLISRSPRRRPVLRLDRQPGGQLRRPALVAPVHPAPAEEQVVAGQPPQGRQTDRGGQDETCRPAGGEARQSRRPLGGVVI